MERPPSVFGLPYPGLTLQSPPQLTTTFRAYGIDGDAAGVIHRGAKGANRHVGEDASHHVSASDPLSLAGDDAAPLAGWPVSAAWPYG